MSFTFKLSQRLARLWAIFGVAALTSLRWGTVPTDPASRVVEFVVDPEVSSPIQPNRWRSLSPARWPSSDTMSALAIPDNKSSH
jgi:hypothetical protein